MRAMSRTHIEDDSLASKLAHVYWIGGSPCAGKSTIADMLGQRFGLQVYHVDDDWRDRLARATDADQPTMARIERMSWSEVFMRPLDAMVADESSYCAEESAMIVEHLLGLPPMPTIAEGTSFLPESVSSVQPDDRRAIWLVPSEAFQRAHYTLEKRPWIAEILADCDDPDGAFENWMARDVEFARRVAHEAVSRSLRVIEVDGSASIDDNADIVARHFRLRDHT
jgi:hypothetical protein